MSLCNARIITLSLFTVLLSACGSIEVHDSNVNSAATPSVMAPSRALSPLEQTLDLAQKSTQPEQAASYYFQAAKIAYDNNDANKALFLLTDKVLPFTSNAQLQGFVLATNIAIKQNHPLDALRFITLAKRLEAANHPQQVNTLSSLRASALEQLANWPAATKERLKLSLSLSIIEREENHILLWQDIQNLTDSEVTYLQNSQDSLLQGWLTISAILRQKDTTIEKQNSLFSQWQANNPVHPAAAMPPQDFVIMAGLEQSAPRTITLVLPLTGQLAKASKAILDGFMSAYYQQPTPRATLKLINTDEFSSMQETLSEAIQTTPDVLIGPLKKNNVAQLNNLELPVPIIALNQLDQQNAKANLYHFSLNAEDEIHELLKFAQRENASHAAILTTQDTWALRQGEEFRNITAANENVKLLTNIDFENTPKGRQNAIKQLLLVNESQARKKWLENTIDSKLEAQDRSRKDLDYVFFAGRLEDAKQMRPLLDFYFAEKIPLLATSTINNTKPNKLNKDADIERIIFSEIPALTNPSIQQEAFNDDDANIIKRLKAMGSDAFLLANRHAIFKQIPKAKMSGLTGILTMDQQQVFRKRSELVMYKKGKLINAKDEKALLGGENP